ncbi:MAG: glutamine synthetase III [Clostridia bacterium]|nr:glutamine synthetase III [Clostridia bacterium]
MSRVPEMFGSRVFNDPVMKKYLPEDVYLSLKSTIARGERLDSDIADAVAEGMKEWAVALGATHFTHWFQPMTGTTAEKHDSFIRPVSDSEIIMTFSGKNLISGEADASSFPSGGLRATFEARGYSAWDPTSYAFLKDNTLCIPTAFCSYRGESLDKKTPLLRSQEAIDREARRLLKLFGMDDVKRVTAEVGAEQEYFLIDSEIWSKRPDLVYCGRTLFGARPPKGQEMNDHYYGQIKPRVLAFMKELDEELWKLGILSNTEHNEVAPAQHELAPIFSTVNIATDHNQLTMEMMKKIAARHGLTCLLHEKPFASVNGSGKHNNWSISTDTGLNLLKPGKTPSQNALFLLILTAIIKAVDENQDLLRISVADAGNDHRLGGNEAPPAVLSIFLGSELESILDDIMAGEKPEDRPKTRLNIGASVLPVLRCDSTDRNRTSPFAFTGNKFEFRMPGSSCSIACPNMIMNTIVANALSEFSEVLEKSDDFHSDLNKLIHDTLIAHKRIIFNGDNYSAEWREEVKARGLANFSNTVEAIPQYTAEKNVRMFEKLNVLTSAEIASRQEVLFENYAKVLRVESLTMIDLVRKDILPAVLRYQKFLLSERREKAAVPSLSTAVEDELLARLGTLTEALYEKLKRLEADTERAKTVKGAKELALFSREALFADIETLRSVVDTLESLVAREFWPFPTYAEILYSVK